MEEVSFKIEMSEEAKAAREALLSKLRRDPHVQDFLRANQLDESFIDNRSPRRHIVNGVRCWRSASMSPRATTST